MVSDDNQLGKNIQHLRKMYGETLNDLGKVITFGKSTVKDFESGRRKPDIKTLNKIAKHYGKTVDELMSTDLTELNEVKMEANSINDMVNLFQIILPLFYSEDAIKNAKFEKGYKYCRRIVESCFNGQELRGTIIVDAFQAYADAAEEIDSPEIVANLMWTIFVLWTQIIDVKEMRSWQSKLLSNGFDIKDYMNMRENESDEVKEKKLAFVSDFDEIIIRIIKTLKSDLKWADLGDYYIALKYVMAMVDSDLSPEMSSAAGMQMMMTFAKIGNPHALNFIKTSLFA